MKNHSFKLVQPVLIVTVLGAAFWANAGQLDPPQGAIQATGPVAINGGDWNANLPVIIDQSGSYILTSDIVAPGGYTGSGIEIRIGNVSLDLNGFNVVGVTGSGAGIDVTGSRVNLAISNGLVRSWGGKGIKAGNDNAVQVKDLHVINNGTGALDHGIAVGTYSTVVRCVARFNAGDGINTSDGAVVIGCVASENTDDGIEVGDYSTVTNCAVHMNGENGIDAHSGSTVRGCAAHENGGTTGSGVGILTHSGTTVGCTASGNRTDGIRVTQSGNVVNCTCFQNTGDGIDAVNSLVRGNSCTGNGTNINATGVSTVLDNHAP